MPPIMEPARFLPPPITETLGFALVEVELGRAAFAGTPSFAYYNPINVVQGGWAATLLAQLNWDAALEPGGRR